MWLIEHRLYLGNYEAGCAALGGERRPVLPERVPAPFAGVVSLCPMPLSPGDPLPEPAAPDIHWKHLPIADGGNGEAEFEQVVEQTVPFIEQRMRAGNVLVHCAAGMSRSVSLIAAVLCARGTPVERAFSHIAEAKAASFAPRSWVGPDLLIAPAPEFQSCLVRLFGRGGARRVP